MTIYEKEFVVARPSFFGGGNWQLKELTDITVIFGKNGSGKSLLLRSIRDNNSKSCHYLSPERSGEFAYSTGLSEEESDPNKRMNRRNSNMSTGFRSESVSRIQSIFSILGYNVASGSEESVNINFNDAEELISKLLPEFEFRIKHENPKFELKRSNGGQVVLNAKQLSSGEAEILGIALDIITICMMWNVQNSDKRILLIDEPDSHLHPDLQQKLSDFIEQISKNYKTQILVATHSTTLLSALGFYGNEKTSVIYLDNSKAEQKAIRFDKTLKEISTVLGGHALMGPLFSVPLLLVEGDDDYRIWSQVPRHNKTHLSVVPCGGEEIKKYQKTLETIFSSIHDDSGKDLGYAILDGDKGLPSGNQKFIKFLKLNCHEAENLYLTNEVLALLNTNWDDAKSKIKEKASEYGNKKDKLSSIDSWDKKNEDIKDVIEEISKILDVKNVHWTSRVGRCIGGQRPTGELEEFLGKELVSNLWNQKS